MNTQTKTEEVNMSYNFVARNIDWCINEDDLTLEEGREYSEDELQTMIKNAKKDLPLTVYLNLGEDDIEDINDDDSRLADILSEEYGFLINSLDYSMKEEEYRMVPTNLFDAKFAYLTQVHGDLNNDDFPSFMIEVYDDNYDYQLLMLRNRKKGPPRFDHLDEQEFNHWAGCNDPNNKALPFISNKENWIAQWKFNFQDSSIEDLSIILVEWDGTQEFFLKEDNTFKYLVW